MSDKKPVEVAVAAKRKQQRSLEQSLQQQNLRSHCAAKPSKLDETKAKNKKALADALVKAQAVKIAKPPSPVPRRRRKSTSRQRRRSPSWFATASRCRTSSTRNSATLKKRISSLGGNVKRSELMRAGLALLSVLDNKELTTVMARVDRIKTG